MGTEARRERPDEARNPRRFGPSKAVVRPALGQSEELIRSVLRSLLGRPRATLRDAASLAGAPDDAVVTVGVIPMHGRRILEIRAESEVIVLRVLLYRGTEGKIILENEQVDVGEGFQRQGHGARLIGRQVEHATRLGIAEIRAYAVRDDEMRYVGYRVWPLLGFDGPLPGEMRRNLPPDLSDARRISDLMRSRSGQDWWHEYGDSVSLTLDLTPTGPALRRLRSYFRRKGLP
jgi:GNAT superfamily N-acetyltransferase